MIEVLSSAITAGGPATLIFELTDSHNQRLANMVNGTATMSLRKESTRRTRHELPYLPTTFDPVAGTVSLDLSSAHTEALAPTAIASTVKQNHGTVVGDIRLEHGREVSYFGPFRFTVRLPETYP